MTTEAPPKRPVASIQEKDVWRANMKLGKIERKKKENRIHVGKITVRTGKCPEHFTHGNRPVTSTKYEGANFNGWLFRCSWGHVFINAAP